VRFCLLRFDCLDEGGEKFLLLGLRGLLGLLGLVLR
jgi:hypothetical protein